MRLARATRARLSGAANEPDAVRWGARDAAISGAGATVLPSYLCRAALDAGLLVELLPTDDPPINTLYLVGRPGGTARPHVERVRGILSTSVARIVADAR